jgi:hypothetical protein
MNHGVEVPVLGDTVFKPIPIHDIVDPNLIGRQDSHFLAGRAGIVVVPGRSEEGPDVLQAAWAWQTPIGQSFELAQIVVPDNSIVTYRGNFAVTRDGTFVDTPEVSGTIGVPEPATIGLVVLSTIGLLVCLRMRS